MSGEHEEANIKRIIPFVGDVTQGIEVAERFTHFFAFYFQEFIVAPIVGSVQTIAGFALSYLIFMMGKSQVHAASVNI